MVRESEERATIVGKLLVNDDVALAKLLTLMRMFRDSVELAHTLLFRRKFSESEVKRRLTKVLSNAWYASSAIKVAKLYKEQTKIKLRKPLLYSVGAKCEEGNRNIRLVSTDKVLIKIPHADGRHEWIEVRVRFGKNYIPLLQELNSCNYGAGVTIKLKGKRENWKTVFRKKLYLYLNVPADLYAKYFGKRVKVESENKFYAGFDFNVDRINMVIVDSYGRIRDIRNIHFPEVINYDKNKSRAIRQDALSKLVEYAVSHGVKYFVIEDLSKPNNIRGNVRKWSIRKYQQQVSMLVKKVGGTLVKVNPAYTSIDAIGISLSKGIDVHTASAYLIALRGIKRYTTIQKATV
ncbi:IS200/IS605 family element transposase accessory protein TnpB [Archaeoglobus profundus]|uniref:Transposase, IS605 OrfB family n=1 Tax=Archaeoglobus profundus (strain DSM 5631 / JCM 9629 / NBRC 100127 / Av18) TaxID=572546 RepID=D2RDK4_ARCPA|nr:IS200/IS605 family element transposase accessory protein TnpB [Archaeoglobus profundus]ADB58198.1 transposase, IS605 OrfB family [Archaeoglobus profundus DSM 5631]